MAALSGIRRLFAGNAGNAGNTGNGQAPVSVRTPRTPTAVPVEWLRLKAFVSACEESRIDLRSLHPSDPVGFFERRARIEGAVGAGVSPDRAAREHGFADAIHWYYVVRYFEARYSELRLDESGVPRIRFVDEFRRAQELVERRLREAAARLDEPIHGVGIERFAELSAAIVRLGETSSRAALSRVLAEFGVGAAAYGAVRRGWLERIGHDSTRTLQRRYMDAFLAARGRFATLLPNENEREPASVVTRRSWGDDCVEVA